VEKNNAWKTETPARPNAGLSRKQFLSKIGYIGESTKNELNYAHHIGKSVRFLEPEAK